MKIKHLLAITAIFWMYWMCAVPIGVGGEEECETRAIVVDVRHSGSIQER